MSYADRALHLAQLLDKVDSPLDAAGQYSDKHQERCARLDQVLLGHWAGRTSLLSAQVVAEHFQSSDFESLGRIGQGQYGSVDAVRSRFNGEVYAIKVIPKAAAARSQQLSLLVERELHMLASEHAPGLFLAFQTPSNLHLVVEYAPCGSLWDRISTGDPECTVKMSENEVGWWARQMVSAIAWIHAKGYAHRDVKPHNFLLYPDVKLKLTDFGSAAAITDGVVDPARCGLPVGTPDYIAPEILLHAQSVLLSGQPEPYTPSVDLWSLGATLYEMAAGRPPFWSPDIPGTYAKINKLDYAVPDTVSSNLRSLLAGLIAPAATRMDLETLEGHLFIQARYTAVSIPEIELGSLDFSFEPSSLTFSSMGDSTQSFTEALMPVNTKWLGWSWYPERLQALTPATPVRPTSRSSSAPPIPKSTQKRRPGPPSRAYQQLLSCIGLSARKTGSASKGPITVGDLEKWHSKEEDQLSTLSDRLRKLTESVKIV